MTDNPLRVLLRLRRMAADEARRDLAEHLRIESEAAAAVAEIEVAIQHDMAVQYAPHRIGHRLVVVVAFYQHGK